jgi:hypothetical protein
MPVEREFLLQSRTSQHQKKKMLVELELLRKPLPRKRSDISLFYI